MSKYSLKGIDWGSEEFDEVMRRAERREVINEDIRIVDEAVAKIRTDEGWRYLMATVNE